MGVRVQYGGGKSFYDSGANKTEVAVVSLDTSCDCDSEVLEIPIRLKVVFEDIVDQNDICCGFTQYFFFPDMNKTFILDVYTIIGINKCSYQALEPYLGSPDMRRSTYGFDSCVFLTSSQSGDDFRVLVLNNEGNLRVSYGEASIPIFLNGYGGDGMECAEFFDTMLSGGSVEVLNELSEGGCDWGGIATITAAS